MPFDVVAQIQGYIDNPSTDGAPPYISGTGLDEAIRYVSVEKGLFVVEWTVAMRLCHRDGLVQGGFVTVVADLGQAMAFWSTSEGPESYSTSDFHTRFFRPLKAGHTYRVESRVINRSRRIGIVESRFINIEDGKLCATVSGGWMLVDRNLGAS